MKAYEQFWASLTLPEWLLIGGLLATLALVALAAAVWGNPSKSPGQGLPAGSAEDQLPYLGQHRKVDPQERTTNLGKYRWRKPD